MWYKGGDYALGIGRILSVISPGATTVVVAYNLLVIGRSMTMKWQIKPTSRVSSQYPRQEKTAKPMDRNI